MENKIKDEIQIHYERAKYGNVKGDYWTDLCESETDYLMGLSAGFSREL